MSDKLLEVKNLKTYFYTDDGVVKSVDDVSFFAFFCVEVPFHRRKVIATYSKEISCLLLLFATSRYQLIHFSEIHKISVDNFFYAFPHIVHLRQIFQ